MTHKGMDRTAMKMLGNDCGWRQSIDLTGERFGDWVAVKPVPRPTGIRTGGQHWECRCKCGATEIIVAGKLRAGRVVRPCRTCAGMNHNKRGNCSPIYNSWRAMRGRCLDSTHVGYALYGGRGIKICDRWNDSFAAFLADMSERPKGRTLDRIDNYKGYEPSNCRWATREEQVRNLRPRKIDARILADIRRDAAAGHKRRVIAGHYGICLRYVFRLLKKTPHAAEERK